MIAVGAVCNTAIYQVDTIPPPPAKAVARAATQVVDGMAVSAAAAFVRLGGTAAIWGRVGEDEVGAEMIAALASDGLQVDGIRRVAGGRSSHAAVIVDGAGQRLVVPYHQPDLDPDPSWLPLAMLSTASLVHADIRWPDGAEAALRAARTAGVPTMLDAEVGPPSDLHRLLPLADFAVFSDAGLTALTGLSCVEAGLRQVAANHAGHVGASCGADGYRWLEGGTLHHCPAPEVSVVDTLAAGDVFHGALALALLEGRPMAEAARFACVAASLKCTRFGGRRGCPSRAEVLAAGG
ncbi:MAG: PfkB family carbohydrate kinase [Alphaproteobacteria bacterium]|nr:PfkB family carbohydrate kinase [Alphaproteobacteria bacterium]